MSRKTIFLVSSGEYSDYRVQGAFARREDAEAAVAAGYGEEVEERVLFDDGELPARQIRWRGFGAIHTDGRPRDSDTPRVYPEASWDDSDNPPPRRPIVLVEKRPIGMFVRVEAASSEAALKATADRLAQIRAELNEPEVSGA